MNEATNENRRWVERIWFCGVLAVYAGLLIISLVRHEPWSDEAQAWLLARDAGIKELFIHYLRYEGSPGLWHLILLIPAKLNFPFYTIKIISGFFGCMGAYLFLKYAPFPKYIRTIFPFTFIILFQYAVVARSYVLFPTIFFLLAIVFPRRIQRPYLFLAGLGLLAMVSLHGTVLAVGLFAADCLDFWRERKRHSVEVRRQQAIVNVVFLILLLGIGLILRVPKDYYNNGNLGIGQPELFITKLFEIMGNVFLTNLQTIRDFNWPQMILLVISLFIWFVTAKWMQSRGMLRYFIIPLIGLLVLYGSSFFNPWHIGVLFVFWIFLLWIGFTSAPGRIGSEKGESPRLIFILITLVLLVHIRWSYSFIAFDWSHSYSGGPAVADYIKKNHLEHKKIFIGGTYPYVSSINVYFKRNIFSNLKHSQGFMYWTKDEFNYVLRLKSILNAQPDLIILHCDNIWGNYRLNSFMNYQFVGIFNGGLYWKDRIPVKETYIVFRKNKKLLARMTNREIEYAIKALTVYFRDNNLIKNAGEIQGSY